MLAEMSPPSPADLADDDALAEILLLLPPPSVLRSRAVCKRWRRITTCPSFVAAYSARRPLELLVYPDGYKIDPDDTNNILAGHDPLDPGVWGYRRFLRLEDKSVRPVDSRDGLLLLALGNAAFLLCNPATRQLAKVPSPAPPCVSLVASGLYFHRPSGEHRVLSIGRHHRDGGGDFYYVLSTGGAGGEPRLLGQVAGGGRNGNPIPSACVALGATLYWSHHPEAGDSGAMVAFDTASEAFRLIPPPPLSGAGASAAHHHHHHIRAFDMDGTLPVSAVAQGSLRMDVWALETGGGGDGWTWARRLRIDLPPRRIVREYQPSDEAVAVVEGGRLLVVVGGGWVALHDVRRGKAVSRVNYRGEICSVTRCLYRTSLVPLPVPGRQHHMHGGEPEPEPDEPPALLHYWAPDDPYMSLFGSSFDTWMLPDLVYANA